MKPSDALLLSRSDVAAFLSIEECIAGVEQAFTLHAQGKALPPKVLGIHVADGGFHIKAGVLDLGKSYFVAKVNANFPNNAKRYGLPLIQGIIVVSDAENGELLALIDSIEITILRTGAATAVAAKYLALEDAAIATICGCGNQGKVSLKALLKVRALETIYVFDIDHTKAQHFAKEMTQELEVSVTAVDNLEKAVGESQICVTCTPSRQPYLLAAYVKPGTFIAAVGADNEEKQELDTLLLRQSKLVVDMLEQCASIGELHHALQQEIMTITDVHAELGEIIAGIKPGRTSNEEIIIFDSTGMALQDVASAAIVYEKAIRIGIGSKLNFAE